ncbi:MAG TPA: isoprenylcysteine carboxylmethyltransferase family protein [Anaerolineaceae bacterium]|nr:isoprenylcysteine carboxylmethyltransferase family protein [Anaerolineaceae bacterium]
MALYGGIHSGLASRSAKLLAARWFGSSSTRFYRLLFNFIVFLTLLPVLWLVQVLPNKVLYTIQLPWIFLTGALQVLAVLGLLVGVLQTGALSFLGFTQIFQQENSAAPAHLVVNGLYHWVRHPLYTCGLLFIWLSPTMSLNLLAFNLSASLYIIIGIQFEELKLLAEFGESYSNYRKLTPMLIPGLSINRR